MKFTEVAPNTMRIHKQHLFLTVHMPCTVLVITLLHRTHQYGTQRRDPSGSNTSILGVCVYVTMSHCK